MWWCMRWRTYWRPHTTSASWHCWMRTSRFGGRRDRSSTHCPCDVSDGARSMNAHEDEEFTAHLGNAVKEAERLKYYPNYFKRDLAADGGFRTVKRILASGKPSEGFRKLWELGRLDLSCEAIIVETRWRKYFDEDL